MANLSSVARSAYSDLLRLLKDDMVTNVRGSLMTKERGGKLYWYAVSYTHLTLPTNREV